MFNWINRIFPYSCLSGAHPDRGPCVGWVWYSLHAKVQRRFVFKFNVQMYKLSGCAKRGRTNNQTCLKTSVKQQSPNFMCWWTVFEKLQGLHQNRKNKLFHASALSSITHHIQSWHLYKEIWNNVTRKTSHCI